METNQTGLETKQEIGSCNRRVQGYLAHATQKGHWFSISHSPSLGSAFFVLIPFLASRPDIRGFKAALGAGWGMAVPLAA